VNGHQGSANGGGKEVSLSAFAGMCFKCHKKGHKTSNCKVKGGASKVVASAIIVIKLDTKQMIVGTKRRTKPSILPGTSPVKWWK